MRIDFRKSKTWIVLVASLVVIYTLIPLWSRYGFSAPSFASPIHLPSHSSTPELHHPTGYADLSPIEQQCEDFFGPSYLEYLATHQLPYCEADSQSHLQCFRSNGTGGLFTSDSLCIAQGVELDNAHESALSLSCRLRNFTQEVREGNKEVEGVQNVEDMHDYFFWTGVRNQLQKWKIGENDTPACSKESGNDKWILLVPREQNINIWHKLAELWQATVTMDIVRTAINQSSGLPYLTPEIESSVQVVFEDDREEPMDDWWTMVTGNPPARKSQLDSGCYGNVILPLPGSSSPFWSVLLQDVGDSVCSGKKFLIDMFLRRLFRYLKIQPRSHVLRNPVITIINRTKNRKIINLEEYIKNLRQKYSDLVINVVDFATISLQEQIILVQSTDILIGHHGAGMTHVMFLPEQSTVVELVPPIFVSAGFGPLSKMRNLTYFSPHTLWIGDWQKVTNTTTDVEPPPFNDKGWQSEEWAYITEKDFQALIDDALRSQDYVI